MINFATLLLIKTLVGYDFWVTHHQGSEQSVAAKNSGIWFKIKLDILKTSNVLVLQKKQQQSSKGKHSLGFRGPDSVLMM